MFELDTGCDSYPKLLGTYHLTDIIDNCSVNRNRPNRVVAVVGRDWLRAITGGLLHERGERVGRKFSRNPRAGVAEDWLAKFAEWLHPGALPSGEAVRAGAVQPCGVMGEDVRCAVVSTRRISTSSIAMSFGVRLYAREVLPYHPS
jgi:hypothetical protein